MRINETCLKIVKLLKFMKGQQQIDIDENDQMYRGLRTIVSDEFLNSLKILREAAK